MVFCLSPPYFQPKRVLSQPPQLKLRNGRPVKRANEPASTTVRPKSDRTRKLKLSHAAYSERQAKRSVSTFVNVSRNPSGPLSLSPTDRATTPCLALKPHPQTSTTMRPKHDPSCIRPQSSDPSQNTPSCIAPSPSRIPRPHPIFTCIHTFHLLTDGDRRPRAQKTSISQRNVVQMAVMQAP